MARRCWGGATQERKMMQGRQGRLRGVAQAGGGRRAASRGAGAGRPEGDGDGLEGAQSRADADRLADQTAAAAMWSSPDDSSGK